jgi:Protein of unknown function (DUF4038)/Domain of Unknown Function (DUF1080)/Putative collagen-binding domain of a collagenase
MTRTVLTALAVLSLTGAAAAADFRDLFNGKDLDGWVVDGPAADRDGKPVWTVRDGAIVASGKVFGFLRCDRQTFGDFTLRVEYRFTPGTGRDRGNSGLGIRTGPFDAKRSAATRASYAAYEVQLMDDAGKAPDVHSTGSLYRYAAPTANPVKPAPEWNTIEVDCAGPRYTITVNGQTVLTADQTTLADVRGKPAGAPAPADKLLRGYVALQSHSGEAAFRRVQVREAGDDPAPPPRLRVSDNRRFLVKEDGTPFFWLGDTAWELFHRLTREDAERYLRDRAAKKFTVIQAVVLAEFDGLHTPNAYGHKPLDGDDPARPNEEYFKHIDWVVNKAGELGLYVGMLPTWGDKWNRGRGAGPEIFTPENAGPYGQWLGRRYRDQAVVWILGGDRAVENDRHRAVIRAMARGLRSGDGGAHLITLHPRGGSGSAQDFHADDWLDFNMRQNGHGVEFTGRYDQTRADYDRTPVKPVIDGEPVYEDHPVAFRARELGHSVAADVRRPLYWDLFSGACGHTYGHHSVWQLYTPARTPVNNPLLVWTDAVDQPGAQQMRHGRALIESRPVLTRVPDDSVIVPEAAPTSVPGAGTRRFVATRDSAGSYAFVYAPVGRPFAVRMDKVTGPRVKAWWFNPREGKATAIGEYANTGTRRFDPPDRGEQLDWVLVLDDASKNFPPPGRPLRP